MKALMFRGLLAEESCMLDEIGASGLKKDLRPCVVALRSRREMEWDLLVVNIP